MIDKSQATTHVPHLEDKLSVPVIPPPEFVEDDEDAKALEELARITPSNARLLELAAKFGPLPAYFDEDEDMPFNPIEE